MHAIFTILAHHNWESSTPSWGIFNRCLFKTGLQLLISTKITKSNNSQSHGTRFRGNFICKGEQTN